HLGYCELRAGAFAPAAGTLRQFIAEYPGDRELATAHFWLGEALAGLGEGQPAAAAYRAYLEHRPLLQGYVHARIGDALTRAGDDAGASVAYRTAADALTATSERADLLERLAASLRVQARCDEAVAAYDEILALAQNPGYRAEIMFQAGAALREAGREDEAAARWNQLVANHPQTTQAAQALALLDQWGLAEVDTVTRAQVDYGAGRYSAALTGLQRIIRAGAAYHGAEAHYWAALCYRQLGQHWESLGELDALLQGHPQSSLVAEARYQRGESLALWGAVDAAAQAFQQCAAMHPQHQRAADALWRAAQVFDESGRSWDASAAYARAAATYPGASYAADARFRAGFTHYLKGAVQTAVQVWAEMLAREAAPAMRARLLLWQGKAAWRLGDDAGGRQKLALAAAEDPEGYWGLRARDLLDGRRFLGQAPPGAFDAAAYQPRGSQAEAEAWLAGWAGAPADGRPPSELPASVTEQESFRQAVDLQSLGDLAAATAAMRQVQAACKDDAYAQYALSLFCRERSLYLPATVAAQRLLALAPAEARRSAPRLVEELAYPTYYADLVLAAAQPTNTDPLLFFALIYQESVFSRDATSYADARGLTQVIPSTGEYIARQLGDGAYTHDRLWRPAVSVRFGMWYLSQSLRMFDDNALVALVAYNAGPRNAAAWAELALGDDDLFFERVTSSQPRAYMRKIYEHRWHYERIYGTR
ncbi:MAG: transglycosylase SLT domain-containing protein, partial [Anaerolineae bacterium]|nr:transglycosylase SLT domain-containing protein [Anaerolineae bacterium]